MPRTVRSAVLSRSVVLALLVIVSAAVSAGCSAFGIATKGDLEKQETRLSARDTELAAETATLQTELGEIAADLGAYREALNTRLATMEAELGELEPVRSELAALGARLDVARQELTILGGRFARDLGEIRGRVDTATAQADEAHDLAELGESRGRHVMDSHLASLRSERRLLRQQLDEIESLLSGMSEWEGKLRGGEQALREVREETLP